MYFVSGSTQKYVMSKEGFILKTQLHNHCKKIGRFASNLHLQQMLQHLCNKIPNTY